MRASILFPLFTLAILPLFPGSLMAAGPIDGQFPPPRPPEGNWENLLVSPIETHWTGMSMSIHSPLLSMKADPDKKGGSILHIAAGKTGLIRSLEAYENYILEYEFRHLTEAPSANGGPGTSGNSGKSRSDKKIIFASGSNTDH